MLRKKSCFKTIFVILVLSGLSMFQAVDSHAAQSTTADRCKNLDTEYPRLDSSWRWLSNDKVVFSVSPGNPTGGIFTNPIVWYQYRPSLDKLEKLDASPYDSIDLPDTIAVRVGAGIMPGRNGKYENVRFSPSGDRIVFPNQPYEELPSYWFVDLKTGEAVNLWINPSLAGHFQTELQIYWYPGETQFIMQYGYNVFNLNVLVTVHDYESTVRRLIDIPPWSAFQHGYSDFLLVGISPDGRYILANPLTPGAWLYDSKTDQRTTLDFSIYNDVVWVGQNTFRGFTSLGIIEYEIETQKGTVLMSRDELNYETMFADPNLSPDGKYFALARIGKNATNEGAGLEVCHIR